MKSILDFGFWFRSQPSFPLARPDSVCTLLPIRRDMFPNNLHPKGEIESKSMWDKYINTILLTWGVWFYILSLIYVLHLVLLLKMHATWMYHPQVLQNVYVVLLNSPNRNGVLKWVETDSRSPKRVGTMSSNRGCQEHKDLWSNPNLNSSSSSNPNPNPKEGVPPLGWD